MTFTEPRADPFRDTLRTAGFYNEWRQRFGEEEWKLLEKYSGALA